MEFVLVRDVLNRRFVYINIEKIISIEIKPLVKVNEEEKQALTGIVMDNNTVIYIDETAEDLFKRISIGTGCIRLETNNIPRMSTDSDNNARPKSINIL